MTTVRSYRAVIAAAAILVWGAADVTAETITNKSIRYFQISGRTADDLDRELSRRGPLTESTRSRHPGATRIKFGGELTYVEHDHRCAIGTAQVTLSTEIILPRWKNRGKADKQLGLIWDTLSSDIKRHEERHAEIARQHARTLEKALKGLRPLRTCAALEAKVATITQDHIEAHDAAQMRFDRIEAINFDRRMMRLLEYRSGYKTGKK
ncbi:MAG: DUF922 domain-containing Zn-dependent protease [Allorhizobium sp.]